MGNNIETLRAEQFRSPATITTSRASVYIILIHAYASTMPASSEAWPNEPILAYSIEDFNFIVCGRFAFRFAAHNQ